MIVVAFAICWARLCYDLLLLCLSFTNAQLTMPARVGELTVIWKLCPLRAGKCTCMWACICTAPEPQYKISTCRPFWAMGGLHAALFASWEGCMRPF